MPYVSLASTGGAGVGGTESVHNTNENRTPSRKSLDLWALMQPLWEVRPGCRRELEQRYWW